MTDFQVPTEAYPKTPAEIHSDGTSDGVTDHHGRDGLIDLVRRDLNYDGQVDRLSYDLDGAGHFDLVRDDHPFDGDVEDTFRY